MINENNQKTHLYNLDLIKITASIFIVFHHYQQISGMRNLQGINFYGGSFNFGYLVELFFMISGYLTVYNYKDSYKFIPWFTSKCKRLYPYVFFAGIVMLATNLTYLALYKENLFNEHYGLVNIITSLLLVSQGWIVDVWPVLNSPTWYLCVLLLCYIIFYLITAITSHFKKKYINFVGYLFFALFGSGMYFLATHGLDNISFFRILNCRGYANFFVGCFLCIIISKVKNKKYLRRIAICLLTFGVIGILFKGLSNWYVLTFLLYPAIIIFAVNEKQVSLSKITNFSGVSFETYIWHVPIYAVLSLLFKIGGIEIRHTWYSMILFAIVVYFIAWFVYKYIEKPLNRKLKHKT